MRGEKHLTFRVRLDDFQYFRRVNVVSRDYTRWDNAILPRPFEVRSQRCKRKVY